MDSARPGTPADARRASVLWDQSFHEHGWFYHFVDSATGARRGTNEISTIDTALLLAGMVTAQEYFNKDDEVGRLARKIWDRIDFRWMMNGNPTLLNMHWKPKDGFSKNFWDHHCELEIMYLPGIASSTSPLPVESGMPGGGPRSPTAGTRISAALRPCLFVSTRKPGSTTGTAAKSARPRSTGIGIRCRLRWRTGSSA